MNAALPLLTVENLSVDFESREGTTSAVRDVSFDVAAGRCLAVVGESGSGKSVTARALLGLAGNGSTVRAASLRFDGIDLTRLSPRQWRALRGRRIGYVLQDALTSLDPLRRVGNEVAEPLEIHDLVTADDLEDEVVALLSDAGIPDPESRMLQYPHELSGGLRQRALIASAVAARPELLIADEPTTALDVTVQAQILTLLESKREQGAAVLLISHDLAVVARMADHIVIMYAGVVVEQGASAQVFDAPQHPYTIDLLAAVPSVDGSARRTVPPESVPAASSGCPYSTRCALADDRCRTSLPEFDAVTDEHRVRCWHHGEYLPQEIDPGPEEPSVVRASGAALLDVSGVSRRYTRPDKTVHTAVDSVSLTIAAGESLGVVGESGSGKSTLARLVLAQFAPDEGTVTFDGQPWSRSRERDRRSSRNRIQLVDQDPLSAFDPRFTVEKVIGEALLHIKPRSARSARVRGLLESVGLDPRLARRRPAQLSGGQRQRVAIARALGPEPELIVADEPVSALDVTVQAQILDLFLRLRRETGTALLFISHDLAVVRHMCSRIAVMKDGRIVETGDTHEVFENPQHPYTRALLSAVPRAPSSLLFSSLAGPTRPTTPKGTP